MNKANEVLCRCNPLPRPGLYLRLPKTRRAKSLRLPPKLVGKPHARLSSTCNRVSLKKTCLKHGLHFGIVFRDRLLGERNIPPLSHLSWTAATHIMTNLLRFI